MCVLQMSCTDDKYDSHNNSKRKSEYLSEFLIELISRDFKS